jgi:hypothetical protein
MSGDKTMLSETLVRRLYELACTPFKLAAQRRRWEEFGWDYTPADDDIYGFRVSLPEPVTLLVDPLGEDIIGASIAFYYWENFFPESHKDPAEYLRQKAAYDAEYEAAASLATRSLPPPFLQWRDADTSAHRAVAWEGTHGLLILQQASFDPQFGIEVDFWLEGCSRSEFRPTTPLIDYLTGRRQHLHEARGIP